MMVQVNLCQMYIRSRTMQLIESLLFSIKITLAQLVQRGALAWPVPIEISCDMLQDLARCDLR